MQTISHKRGDTLTLAVSWVVDGVPVDLSSYTVVSQVRTPSDRLILALTVALANQSTNPGQFVISATAVQTADWSVGQLICDIEFRSGAVVVSSETFAFDVVKDVTR